MQISVLTWHLTFIYIIRKKKNWCILGLFIIYGILEFFRLTSTMEYKEHFLRWEQSNYGVAKSFCPRYLKESCFILGGTQTNFNTTQQLFFTKSPREEAERNATKDLFPSIFFQHLGNSSCNSNTVKNFDSHTYCFIKIIMLYLNFHS